MRKNGGNDKEKIKNGQRGKRCLETNGSDVNDCGKELPQHEGWFFSEPTSIWEKSNSIKPQWREQSD